MVDDRYLIALGATVVVEAAVVGLVLLGRAAARRERPRQLPELLALVLCANLLTHPIAWLASSQWAASWLLLELGVLLVEAVLLHRIGRLGVSLALGLSLLANGVSAVLGLLLTW